MTEQTLDRVARALATGMPRRAVMKAAAAVAAGGVLTMVSRHEEAHAANGGYCVKGSSRCGNACFNPSTHQCCRCPGGPQRVELQFTCSQFSCH
jgi:hypothetical protein